MNYNKQEVKEGITLHQIDTKNFKTNLYEENLYMH